LIAAVIAMCLAAEPTRCQSIHLSVEARACNILPIRGTAPVGPGSEPVPVIVSVRCR
jgi:hypothetical protein